MGEKDREGESLLEEVAGGVGKPVRVSLAIIMNRHPKTFGKTFTSEENIRRRRNIKVVGGAKKKLADFKKEFGPYQPL